MKKELGNLFWGTHSSVDSRHYKHLKMKYRVARRRPLLKAASFYVEHVANGVNLSYNEVRAASDSCDEKKGYL